MTVEVSSALILKFSFQNNFKLIFKVTFTLLKRVVQSLSCVFDPLLLHGLQCARLPCPLLSPGVCSNLSPLSR